MATRTRGMAGGPGREDLYLIALYEYGGRLYGLADNGKLYCQASDSEGWYPCSMQVMNPPGDQLAGMPAGDNP